MQVSFICSGVRPQNWLRICQELFRYKTKHEFIFVGPHTPKEVLPENAIFIQSNVKPSQCIEIAARRSSGKYVVLIADDLSFFEFNLDILVNLADKGIKNKEIFGVSFKRSKIAYQENDYHYWSDEDSPQFVMMPFFPRTLWIELGGIDSNFVHSYGDLDLQMRALEKGYSLVRKEDIFVEELMHDSHSLLERFIFKIHKLIPNPVQFFLRRIFGEYLPKSNGRGLHDTISFDRKVLDNFWIFDANQKTRNIYSIRNDGKAISKRRLQVVESFSNEGILIASQGPCGQW
jgi:hypothetical protein